MLSLEEQIIDATTEEGKQKLKEFEEKEKANMAHDAALDKGNEKAVEENSLANEVD